MHAILLLLLLTTARAAMTCPAPFVARPYQNVTTGAWQIRCCEAYVGAAPALACLNETSAFSVTCWAMMPIRARLSGCDCGTLCSGVALQNQTCSGACACGGVCCAEGARCNVTVAPLLPITPDIIVPEDYD